MSPDSTTPAILLVDDDEDQLFLSRRLIEKVATGEFIGVATSGVAALKTLSELVSAGSVGNLKAIFLDINMPELHGFEVLRWIRAHEKLVHVKTIMLSSSDDPKDVKESLSQGAHCYLIKLPSVRAMSVIVREILDLAGESVDPVSSQKPLSPI